MNRKSRNKIKSHDHQLAGDHNHSNYQYRTIKINVPIDMLIVIL